MKIAPLYQEGPGIASTLPAYFWTNSGVNTLSFAMVPLSISESSMDATRLQSDVVVFTVIALGPVTSFAWHLPAQK